MLKQGIYENIINKRLEEEIRESEEQNFFCQRNKIDKAESSKILSDYLAKVIYQQLDKHKELKDRVNLINRILQDYELTSENLIVDEVNLLTEVMTHQKAVLQEDSKSKTARPESGFSVSTLFTGGSSTLSLIEEIRREIASADEICLIVSFLKVSGLRLLLDDLKIFCQREGTRLRLITTTYCGVTEAKAIKQLSELPHTDIRISYQTDMERLHAKAYIFLRNSGMNTAYIGSSNLSKSAQTDGLEWNIRVTSVENPHIIRTALATFDLYWNSNNFEDFRLGGIDKFTKELHINRFRNKDNPDLLQRYSLLPHQKRILDKLKVERENRHNYRNLIVAATGTGKTVISAFDYLLFHQQRTAQHLTSCILFTAHREEILKQSLNTYRSVLQDANFGTLWVGDYKPNSEHDYESLFVSISMFNSKFDTLFSTLPANFYDYIVIDEAHHSQADSYRKIFEHFKPKLLIGLTATPERMDGRDLRLDFGNRISAEIRLPQALQAGLLTPFQYFCVADDTDLSDDNLWKGAKYETKHLSDKLCSTIRTKQIVNALQRYLTDENTCKALCFCVDKNHAEFTAHELKRYGFVAASLTSDTPPAERRQVLTDLRNGVLHYLCVVDIFNEGVDIPEVDTVLFLRPTESLTIFLQQLGRGLRLSPGKTELTVLDFVGQANKKYDFAGKFRALSLKPDKNIVDQIKNGFTFLPMGCNIIMEKVARQHILDTIQNAIYNKTRLIKEINSYSEIPTLSEFLDNNGQDIRIIYSQKRCWTSLKRFANKISYPEDEVTKTLEKKLGNLIHYNTPSFLQFIEDFLNGSQYYKEPKNARYATMLYYSLYGEPMHKLKFTCSSLYEALEVLLDRKYHYFRQEILELTDYLMNHLDITTTPLDQDIFPGIELYGCYTRSDIFSLVGKQTVERTMQGHISGVVTLEDKNATVLFVTLNKSERDFSPSTLYEDYIINKDYFHWQSQNKDYHNKANGQVYTMQAKNKNKIILFVREENEDAYGNSMPFHCFGLVDYVSSYGDAPMNITWKLQEPVMPKYLKVV